MIEERISTTMGTSEGSASVRLAHAFGARLLSVTHEILILGNSRCASFTNGAMTLSS